MASDILKEDLNLIAETELPWMRFHSKTFLVTGATGLLGSLFIRSLLTIHRKYDLDLHIIAVVRDLQKAKHTFQNENDQDIISYICTDICDSFFPEASIDYVLHAAAITKSQIMVNHPSEVIRSSLLGMLHILEIAKLKKPLKMIYLSSMEMYGTLEDQVADETALGYLDLSNVRSCYPESKRMCECMAKAWESEYSVPVCTIRLAQTFGPGIFPDENRVFAQFARSVINNKDIVLKTEGMSEGNYCYTRDAILAVFYILFYGKPGEAYNVVNEDTHMQIREMANLVADRIANNAIKVTYDIPKDKKHLGYAVDTKLSMTSEKIRALGWKPEVGMEEAYRRMIDYMI